MLQDLLIQPSRLLTLDPSAMTHLQLDNVIGRPAEDGPALMIALQHLTHLQHLQLFDNFWQTPLAPQQFSALTASGGLTALLVMDRSLQPLPQGAVQHLLPAGEEKCCLLYGHGCTDLVASAPPPPEPWVSLPQWKLES